MGRMRRRWGEGREQATALRMQGWSYAQIQAELGIAKSTLSGWLSDVALSDEQRAGLAQRGRDGARSRAVAIRAGRLRRTEVLQAEAAAEIGPLTERELFLLGVVAYWCEGSKEKPWRPTTRVKFINSDPGLIRLFLEWLRVVGVDRDRLQFALSIHETADVAAAQQFWVCRVGLSAHELTTVWLKRHRPTTSRHNLGDDYVGCLVVSVRRSTDLNRRIAGWWRGITSA